MAEEKLPPVLIHDEVDSTQSVARGLAEAGAEAGTVVLARTQTAGRGTRGRSWWSPRGNLYATVILRPEGPASLAPLLGLGVAACLAERLGVWVKWPNDLVDSEGRKLGGLLSEMETRGAELRYVLIGLGLNVSTDTFPAELPMATSVSRVWGRTVTAEELHDVVITSLRGGDRADRLGIWRERAHTLGRRVTVGGVTGVASALRDDGGLVIDGVVVYSGEVLAAPVPSEPATGDAR